MVGNTKELSCINAITLDSPAIYLGHILPGSRHIEASWSLAPVKWPINLSHLRYRLLMIQGSSFLVCIYIP